MATSIPPPHGGKLIHRILDGKTRPQHSELTELPALTLRESLIYDARNIATGVYSPLEGFLPQDELESVLKTKRLTNGLPWTIPIVLDADPAELQDISVGEDVLLRDEEARFQAIIHVDDIYTLDKRYMVSQVFGTTDPAHPGVANTLSLKEKFISGRIDVLEMGIQPFPHHAFPPEATRKIFQERGWRSIVGFQTRNVPHLGHEYIQKTALSFMDGLFINPVIGKKKAGDFKDEVIMETYKVLIEGYYPKERVLLGILETDMRYAGPREAIFHAIVRKNFGCTHFIVGRDHAGVGNYYEPYAAQKIFDEFPDLGIEPLFFTSFFHCNKCDSIANEKICPHSLECRMEFSGTLLRNLFNRNEPSTLSLIRPEVAKTIAEFKEPFVGMDFKKDPER